uniref:Uncharacterized protein n=1 Tax=Manihot esculenta TaxID=3983 RepID=A0A2C9UMS1_MANES
MKTRSFRYEDYNNRRVFLRSYPLQWEEDDRANESTRRVAKEKSKEKPIKKMILSVVQWGEGRVVIIRKFKDKLIVYIIACKNIIDTPIVKHPTATQGLNRSPVQQPYKL